MFDKSFFIQEKDSLNHAIEKRVLLGINLIADFIPLLLKLVTVATKPFIDLCLLFIATPPPEMVCNAAEKKQ
jgi:hypothetical protein